MLNVDQTMDWKIDFYGQYFADISNIRRPQKNIEYNGRNIGKLPNYRGYIGLEPINQWKKSSVKE